MKITARRIRLSVFTVMVAGGLLAVVAKCAGRWLVVDAPERAEVILVLAGETDRRPERGLQLLDQGYGRLLVFDVPAAAKVYGFTEAELASRRVEGLPEAKAIMICPIRGLSTKAESHDAEQCLDRLDSRRVLIVTSDFHTRRALSIFRHELRGRSFSSGAVYDEEQFGIRWWQHRQWAKTCVDEWLRVIWWYAVDRWR